MCRGSETLWNRVYLYFVRPAAAMERSVKTGSFRASWLIFALAAAGAACGHVVAFTPASGGGSSSLLVTVVFCIVFLLFLKVLMFAVVTSAISSFLDG